MFFRRLVACVYLDLNVWITATKIRQARNEQLAREERLHGNPQDTPGLHAVVALRDLWLVETVTVDDGRGVARRCEARPVHPAVLPPGATLRLPLRGVFQAGVLTFQVSFVARDPQAEAAAGLRTAEALRVVVRCRESARLPAAA